MRDNSLAVKLQRTKVDLKVAQAKLATLQARQHSGDLMPRKRMEERGFGFFRAVRDRMLGLAPRHAAVLASRFGLDPLEVSNRIESRLQAILDDLVPQLESEPALARGLKPDPKLTVTEWADAHRMLSSRGSAEAGPYRSQRTPYLREIMDALSVHSPVRRVIFKKAAQVGSTEAGNCWLGYIMDMAPGPALAVQPTVELAKRFSKQRIDPLVADSPRLREKIAPARSRDSGNTVMMKEFPGGVLVITGANSAVGLRSMPARYLFLDEVDAYPGDVGDEGDPVTLAEARTRTFSFRSKTFITSTPRIKGTSVVAREYDRSDRRKYFVPCPHCQTMQVLVFDRLRYDKDRLEAAHYECEGCGTLIAEHEKTEMLERGAWQATATSDDPHMVGYHINALYSPVGWLSWLEIAKQWENEASKSVDARKGFINTVLGEEYEEEANPVPDWQRLYDRREEWHYRTVPERGLFLTAGADVQVDRIEVDVWAWGRQGESWLVEHIDLAGDPGRPEPWAGLTALLGATWEHASGKRMGLTRLAIDTGAFTQAVYQWARGQDRAQVLPVKGVPQYDRVVPVTGPTKVEVLQNGVRLKRGLNLWTVSVSFFKREFYKQLEQQRPTDEQLAEGFHYPAGYVHLSTAARDEWIKQAVSEQQVVVRGRHGFALRTEWRQLRNRNEALDMRVYARAAAWLAGVDRWGETQWRDLEGQLGLDAPAPEPVTEPPPPKPASAPSAPAGDIRMRRVMRRRVMSMGRI